MKSDIEFLNDLVLYLDNRKVFVNDEWVSYEFNELKKMIIEYLRSHE